METRITFKNSVKVIFMAMAMLTMSCGLESCDSNAVRVVEEMEEAAEKGAQIEPETNTGLDDMAIFEYDEHNE